MEERSKMAERKRGGAEMCKGGRTGAAGSLDMMGGHAGEDNEVARDLENGANSVVSYCRQCTMCLHRQQP